MPFLQEIDFDKNQIAKKKFFFFSWKSKGFSEAKNKKLNTVILFMQIEFQAKKETSPRVMTTKFGAKVLKIMYKQ